VTVCDSVFVQSFWIDEARGNEPQSVNDGQARWGFTSTTSPILPTLFICQMFDNLRAVTNETRDLSVSHSNARARLVRGRRRTRTKTCNE
jgi:hypothetical protein